MSLKAFHIAFIAVSTALALGFAAWCFARAGQGSAYDVVGAGSLAAAGGLVYYGARFLRKMRGIGYL